MLTRLLNYLEEESAGLFEDRFRLFLLSVLGLIAVVLGFFLFDSSTYVRWAGKYGYWFMAFISASFTYYAYRVWLLKLPFRSMRRKERLLFFFLFSLGVFVFYVHESLEYKILIDEPMLSATALNAHTNREFFTPTRAHIVHGEYLLSSFNLDKRPFFFPFLVSTLHDLTGYRLENAFYLNRIVVLFIFVFSYSIGRMIGGPRCALAALLLTVSIPHLAQMGSGGGIDVLNYLMHLVMFASGFFYLREPNAKNLNLLCFSLLLLVQTRYESVIFFVVFGLILLFTWFQKKKVIFSWGLFALPILMLPYAWRHHVMQDQKNWQMFDRPDAAAPFDFGLFWDNIGHAIIYFADTSFKFPNSYAIAGIGTVSLVFCVISVLRDSELFEKKGKITVCFLAFMVGYAILFVLMMTYAFGQFDSIIVSRLAIPFYVPFIYGILFLFFKFSNNRTLQNILFGALIVNFIFYALPNISNHRLSKAYNPAAELKMARKFIRDMDGERFLMISPMTPLYISLKVETVSTSRANKRKLKFSRYLENPANPPVFVFEHFFFEGGDERIQKLTHGARKDQLFLSPEFETELVEELFVEPYFGYRISRVTGINLEQNEDSSDFDEADEGAAQESLSADVIDSSLDPDNLEEMAREEHDPMSDWSDAERYKFEWARNLP